MKEEQLFLATVALRLELAQIRQKKEEKTVKLTRQPSLKLKLTRLSSLFGSKIDQSAIFGSKIDKSVTLVWQ